MAANISCKVEKRVVGLVKSCYFGSGLNKAFCILLIDRKIIYLI